LTNNNRFDWHGHYRYIRYVHIDNWLKKNHSKIDSKSDSRPHSKINSRLHSMSYNMPNRTLFTTKIKHIVLKIYTIRHSCKTWSGVWSLFWSGVWSHFWSQFWSGFFLILFKNAFCFIYKNSDYNLEGIIWWIDYIHEPTYIWKNYMNICKFHFFS
jgi:hypothetical protein